VSLYTPDLLDAAATRFSTEQGLRIALERGDFELVFQPEIDASTLEVGLVEALLRWRLSDGRLASPGEFLAVAEESGLVLGISDWVLGAAIETVATWRVGPWPQARIAINVSVRQILDRGFEQRLLELLERHALPPQCIELELTENVLQTGRAAVEAIRRLRAAGVGIALDDFGTGYSSLASLEHLPLSRVKLDKSLVATIDTNPRSLAITRAIAGLCEQLGLAMTAEGIERPEQLALLLTHPSICLQGYLLCRPVSRADLPARILELPGKVQSVLLEGPGPRSATTGEAVSLHQARMRRGSRPRP
jgi:EAL domain-containing protein (putative c-di-GMP-specific phosphodiesterase class I)